MATKFSDALAVEIAGLEQQLEEDPRFTKLRELRRIEALYADPQPPISPVATSRPKSPSTAGRSPSPERQAILEAARELVRERTEPVSTSLIHESLMSRGVSIPGTSPKNNLSAMLSNAPDFKSHGRAGWTLTEVTPEASDDLLTRPAPEASMSSPASPAGEPPSVRPVDPAPGGGG